MARRLWRGTSRLRLIAMFVVVLLPPAVTLIWSGLRLLDQDRDLQAQREVEAREAAADAITRSLAQSLAEVDRWMGAAELPEGALGIVITSTGLQSHPAERMLWKASRNALPEVAVEPFIAAETAEFRGAAESALKIYRDFARLPDTAVRAGALLRAARVERSQRKTDQALEDYRRLAAIQGIAIDGIPADLVARRAICSLLESSGKEEELRQHAHSLENDFLAGRWLLDRPIWELAASEIERWAGRPVSISGDRKILSIAADSFFERARSGNLLPSGRESLFIEVAPATLIWRTELSQLEAVVIAPTILDGWMRKASQSTHRSTAQLSLLTSEGKLVAGEKPELSSRATRRSSAETGLPWTLVLNSYSSPIEAGGLTARRRLLGLGLVAIILLLAGGSYFLWRAIERELAVARLQTDFVAAVSHEFRTPLTSLRHVTELLEEDDGLPPGPEQERRKTFYAALGRNTERLHRLVESLLDFSRMETGKKPWKLQPMDAGTLAAGVAAEFQKEVEVRGVQIDLAVEQRETLLLRADAAALGHALWNLLDNAVKYSPERGAVHVSVGRHPRGIAIAVRDEGFGIPAHERRDIFLKFVRGKKANELGIRGTGLGLAMVAHIVEAHGGAIELESEEGKGSTFRLVLPAQA